MKTDLDRLHIDVKFQNTICNLGILSNSTHVGYTWCTIKLLTEETYFWLFGYSDRKKSKCLVSKKNECYFMLGTYLDIKYYLDKLQNDISMERIAEEYNDKKKRKQ